MYWFRLRNISIVALVLSVGAALSPATARGQNIFVVNNGAGTIGEYTSSGAVVNASLVSGLNGPWGIAVSGTNLFVTNNRNNTIGEYTTSGTVVNASLISGLNAPWGIAVVSVPSTVALTAVSNATIIAGGTGSLGATVSNSAVSGANNLRSRDRIS